MTGRQPSRQDMGASSGPGARASHQAATGLDHSASPPRAAFTPGPWERDENEEYSLILSGADGVCLMEGHTVGPFKPELREANARLIAAAPELYEALDDLVRSFGVCAELEDCPKCRKAVAALAKARGDAR